MPYHQEALKQLGLKTGDLLLSSNNTLFGTLIQQVTNSKWSHIGMIVIADDGTIECFSSELTVTLGQGVQINPLDKLLNENVAFSQVQALAIRRLAQPLSAQQIQALRSFINEQLGKPYEYNLFDFIKPVVFGPMDQTQILANIKTFSAALEVGDNAQFNKILQTCFVIGLNKLYAKPDDKAQFCSELATAALQEVGLIPAAIHADTVVPKALTAEADANAVAQLQTANIFLAEQALAGPSSPVAALAVAFDAAKDKAQPAVTAIAEATTTVVAVADKSGSEVKPNRCCVLL